MSVLNYKLDLLMDARDNIKQALADKGQVVGNDMRTYAQAIRNINGQVKLFSTEQEMRESTGNSEGSYSIVYEGCTEFLEPNKQFTTFYFPQVIQLDKQYEFQTINTLHMSAGTLSIDIEVSNNTRDKSF